jgi:hypothetical protein
VERGGPSVGKVGEWCVKSCHLQGCSPRLCRLRTDGLTLMSKYWTYRSHVDDMSLVSWCSYVTTWLKSLSPTPRLLWGRKNEVTQGDGWASLSSVAKTSSGCRGLFQSCGDSRKVAYTNHRRCMIWDHTWMKREKRVACWLSFSLQGVHRFESPRLSDISIACLRQSSRR